jgi:hypothetical protein
MQATIVHSRHALSGLGISLLAVSGSAQAYIFCVSTAQEFQDALTQSSYFHTYNLQDNVVKMVHGTYKTGAATGNAPFFFYSPNSAHSMRIYGGYADNCALPTRQTPPTILDGNGTTGVLVLRNTYGDIAVSNLTLQNGQSDEVGAGLQVNYSVSVNGSVTIQDNIIRNNHSSVDAGGLYVSGAGIAVQVDGNLIEGNRADELYGAGYVSAFGSNELNSVQNNTVTQNTSGAASNPVGGLFCGGTSPCRIYNNIFISNTAVGLYLGDANAEVESNDYGTLGGTAPALSAGNFSVNPKFIDPSAGNFRLAGDSPLLGVSPYVIYINDLDGNPFTTHAPNKIDLGAYEETIFIDGFDGS